MVLCEKAIAHIAQMNQPAVSAIFDEGGDLWGLESKLGEMLEIAGHSLGQPVADPSSGARKLEAAQVTEVAGHVFEHVTTRRPTITTDPVTFEISGDWPKFLSAVFSALRVDASVEAQAKALGRKHRTFER